LQRFKQEQLSRLNVSIPDPSEQKTILCRLEKSQEEIDRNKSYLEKIKLMKCGLMQDLLTGKVGV